MPHHRLIATTTLAIALLVLSCRDHRRPVRPEAPSPRVVTFSPALTDIVFTLGLGDHVVGVTNYCRLPAGEERRRLGGASDVSAEALASVAPDLLLVQTAHPERFDGARRLVEGLRVETFTIETLDDIERATLRVASLLGHPDAATPVVTRLRDTRRRAAAAATRAKKPRILFMSGYERPLVAGPHTFAAELISLVGGVNAGADVPGTQRWRDANTEAVVAARPDVVLCSVSPGQEAAATEQLTRLVALSGGHLAGHVRVVSDPGWTVPSPHLSDLISTLAKLVEETTP